MRASTVRIEHQAWGLAYDARRAAVGREQRLRDDVDPHRVVTGLQFLP
jgi:hypothetical protein